MPHDAALTAMRAALSDAATGFNAKLAALAPARGIDPFEIDWSDTSDNFIQAFIDPAQIDVSEVMEFPACVIWASSPRQFPAGTRTIGPMFDGEVTGHVAFALRHRPVKYSDIEAEGASAAKNLEKLRHAVIRAAMEAFHAVDEWPEGVGYHGLVATADYPFELTGDGWEAVVEMQFMFDVSI